MFGWFRKKKGGDDSLAKMDERLTKNSKLLADDHETLVNLSDQNRALKQRLEGLQIRIDQLEGRQNELREGLRSALEQND